jgi:hypothetical protein
MLAFARNAAFGREAAIFLQQVGDLCEWFLLSHGRVPSQWLAIRAG